MSAPYRKSYYKTLVLALGVAGIVAVALAVLVRLPWRVALSFSLLSWLAWSAACAVLVLVFIAAIAVVNGGLIGLYRDSLEARGLPYAPQRPREWVAGPLLRALRAMTRRGIALRPGDWVEVRSLPEILATLDDRGRLEELPFMPEMVVYCGHRFRVLRRIEKIHDYVTRTGMRRLRNAVLLESLRCGGESHGGCQAACQLIWKEAWLKRPGAQDRSPATSRDSRAPFDLQALTRVVPDSGEPRYACQMTDIVKATTPLSWGDPRHYIRDLVQGNVRPGAFMVGVSIALFNWVQRRRGGVIFPHLGTLEGKSSPHQVLGLKPGEWVRVKAKSEIEKTLNYGSRNRGLWFDREMLRYCGGSYRVAGRVERLVDESNGRLVELTNPNIVLEGVTASGDYLAFCPQNEVVFWHEIWFERSSCE